MRNTTLSFIETELRSAPKRQPWSSSSQPYAPVSVLLEHLADGWAIGSEVIQEEFWYGAGRHVYVYHFQLTKGIQTRALPVLSNPVVRGLLHQLQPRLESFSDDDARRSPAEISET
jgi:hypothetical protein